MQRAPWTYDAAGNLLNDGTTSYTYDALNRVITRATGGITTTNTSNGDGVLLRQQTGSTTTTYTQDLASPLDQILSDGTSTYLYGAERLLAQQGSTRSWYDADALGSVRQTLDGSGTPTGSPIFYDPWGQVQSGTPPTFGFTGELQQGNAHHAAQRHGADIFHRSRSVQWKIHVIVYCALGRQCWEWAV